jgi:hypothetical protein
MTGFSIFIVISWTGCVGIRRDLLLCLPPVRANTRIDEIIPGHCRRRARSLCASVLAATAERTKREAAEGDDTSTAVFIL